MCLPANELEWYKANKLICCEYVSSRLFLPSCLWWQLSSVMTEASLTPPALGAVPHDDLDDASEYGWVGAYALNTFGRSIQAVLLHSCRTFCYAACVDQYFIFVYPLSAITFLTALERGGLTVMGLAFFFFFFFISHIAHCRVLSVWPWPNHRSKVGRCCFHS